MKQQQINFWLNQARPSAVLSTDLQLKKEQVDELRQMWNEQAKGMDGCGPGGTPILTYGLKVQPWSTPGKDAQIAEIAKLNTDQIALAFRIPLQVLGLGENTYSSTESLMQAWVASGLGFALNHVEEAFGLTFDLAGQPDEYIEFDTAALLRSAFKDRIEGLTRAVQGGIFSPNEARELESLDAVKAGGEPRVQQQVVPLSAAEMIQPKAGFGGSTGPHAPPAPGPGASPPAEGQPAPKTPASSAKEYQDQVDWHVRGVLHAADRYERAERQPTT
jgi:phage portal protein BeeE